MPPVNRWLVTEHSKGSSGDSNEQILECNGSISGMQSMKVNADINVVNDIPQPIVGGAFNATFNENKEGNEEEGVVFIDPKRRRVVGLDEVTTGPGLDVGPKNLEWDWHYPTARCEAVTGLSKGLEGCSEFTKQSA
nr:hypothetical protein Iba_chr06aCG8400 [Ipomoea batatas]